MSRFSSLPTILVHAPNMTPRVNAALHWALDAVLGLSWATEADHGAFESSAAPWRVQYGGVPVEGVCYIKPEGLLESTEVRATPPDETGEERDVLALIFWMGSRMEEWCGDAPRDTHGRFDPRSSIPMERGWLSKPVCENWAFELGAAILGSQWPAHLARLQAEYTVEPTLDVDSAYAFLGKGWWRTGGALVRDVLRGHWTHALRRSRVCRGVASDPYDTYANVQAWHAAHGLTPKWFFLLARFGPHDKGLPSKSSRLQSLMRDLEEGHQGCVQWHPGYAAALDQGAMETEFEAFKEIMGRPPAASRQHYLRMAPGQTRRQLIALGIGHDHTEGHAAVIGFRGGFSRPRRWYDIEKEALTDLLLHPFAAMDATLCRYMKVSPDAVPGHVRPLADSVREVGGTLRLLWHNESLAPEGEWEGWEQVYPNVLQVVC